jgi:hypothetical protein
MHVFFLPYRDTSSPPEANAPTLFGPRAPPASIALSQTPIAVSDRGDEAERGSALPWLLIGFCFCC